MSAAAVVTLIEDGTQYELRELCRLHGANINRVRARWRKLGYPEVVGLDMLTAPVQMLRRPCPECVPSYGRQAIVVDYPPHGKVTFKQMAEDIHPELKRSHQFFKARWVAAGRPVEVEPWMFTANNTEFVAGYGTNGYKLARDPGRIIPTDPRYADDSLWSEDVPFADLVGLSYERNTGAGRGSIPDEEWIGRIGTSPVSASLVRMIYTK